MSREPSVCEFPTCPECGAEEPHWNGNRTDPDSLRAELARLKRKAEEQYRSGYADGWHQSFKKSQAEIERLRAALSRIADYDGTHSESVRELARAALEPKP